MRASETVRWGHKEMGVCISNIEVGSHPVAVAGITYGHYLTSLAFVADISNVQQKTTDFALVGTALASGFIFGPGFPFHVPHCHSPFHSFAHLPNLSSLPWRL